MPSLVILTTAVPPSVVKDRTYVFTPSLVVTVHPSSVVVAGFVVAAGVVVAPVGRADEGRVRPGFADVVGRVVRAGAVVSAGGGASLVSETAAGAGS
ncbi:hypothetical protein GCM10010112_43140 [Actinoplanes lobatus]|uniref:Uncharacterized protein n=1 Tax=Actinoplanes lobatus TaxID=113568 RepID=A0ABQ4AFK2_9ACTN|nr:hypothetical protein GCM10010112_43140 [Actinoplanes lobatus]GIE39792.1 hypothetical protein Alo02nite_26900 [Actinoplanes lobatus]